MKNLFFTAILACLVFTVKAEDYKAFRVDLGLGYAIPKDGGGVIFSIEPKYAITPNIAVGIRGEGAVMAKILWEKNATGEYVDSGSTELKANASYLLTGDYYLITKKLRPFVGLGFGAYNLAGSAIEINNVTTPATDVNINLGAKTNFGFMLRAGFDVFHMRLALEYNFAGKDNLDKSYNYLGAKFSVYIGGGVKK